jgi:hypothetical protein
MPVNPTLQLSARLPDSPGIPTETDCPLLHSSMRTYLPRNRVVAEAISSRCVSSASALFQETGQLHSDCRAGTPLRLRV